LTGTDEVNGRLGAGPWTERNVTLLKRQIDGTDTKRGHARSQAKAGKVRPAAGAMLPRAARGESGDVAFRALGDGCAVWPGLRGAPCH
jgi:hypothetical protein